MKKYPEKILKYMKLTLTQMDLPGYIVYKLIKEELSLFYRNISMSHISEIYVEALSLRVSIDTQHLILLKCDDSIGLRLIEGYRKNAYMKKKTRIAAHRIISFAKEKILEMGGNPNDLSHFSYGDYVQKFMNYSDEITITRRMISIDKKWKKIHSLKYFDTDDPNIKNIIKEKYKDLLDLAEEGLISGIETVLMKETKIEPLFHPEETFNVPIQIDHYLSKMKLSRITKHVFVEDKYNKLPGTIFKLLRLFDYVELSPKIKKSQLFHEIEKEDLEFHLLNNDLKTIHYSFRPIIPLKGMYTEHGKILSVKKEKIVLEGGIEMETYRAHTNPYYPVPADIAIISNDLNIEMIYNIWLVSDKVYVIK